MRVPSSRSLLLLAALVAIAPAARAQDAELQVAANAAPEPFTAEELDNLLAPVALYPDPILAQVLVAATYPEQVELAARHVALYGNEDLDGQPWHVSVRAVAHYVPLLNLMADRVDWTTAVGQAHATQPDDVMESVQNLRRMAYAQGNLVSTKEQEVVVRDRYIYITPAQPQVVYVPTYDPVVVYYQPIVVGAVYRHGWHFGVAFPIGIWLNYDVDWHHHHVYYHGWTHPIHAHNHGWWSRSRPYVVVNNIYVNPRHTTVVLNRTVVHRRVHFDRLGGYNQVHRRVTWDRRRQYEDRRQVARRDGPSWDRTRRIAPERTAQPRRAPVTRSDAYRTVARSNPANPSAPTRANVPRRTSTAGTTARPTTGNRIYPTRTNPQRAVPQSPRATPTRATPTRATPTRSTPTRTPVTRAPVTRRDAAGTIARSQPRSQPRAQPSRAPTRSAPSAAPRGGASRGTVSRGTVSRGTSSGSGSRPAASSGSRSRSSSGGAVAPRGGSRRQN